MMDDTTNVSDGKTYTYHPQGKCDKCGAPVKKCPCCGKDHYEEWHNPYVPYLVPYHPMYPLNPYFTPANPWVVTITGDTSCTITQH